MIRGSLTSRLEITVPLRLRAANGFNVTVDAIVDTGFTASLTLPDDLILQLQLIRTSNIDDQMADGTPRNYPVFDVEIEWGDTWRFVPAWNVDGQRPLIGLKLLAGHRLHTEFRDGGFVEVSPLSELFVPP